MEEKQNVSGSLTENGLPEKITKERLYAKEATVKGKVLYWTKITLFTLLSSLLVSFAAFSLITPNEFTIGGISGLAILLSVATNGNIPQSIVVFSLNLPLVLIAFFYVKKKFAILSACNIVLQTLWLILLENTFPDFKIVFESNGEKIFAAIASGLCIGAAVALAFKVGGSTGGADILAVILQRKFHISSFAWLLFAINCAIISSSIFVFYDAEKTLALNVLPLMTSAFEAYIESKTNDSLTNGFHSAIEFRIITDKPDEMAHALMRELGRGVTAQPATGMYTKETHTMLFCIVSRRQVVALKRIIKTIDPDSFAVMANVSQVLGLGFYRSEN